MAWRLVSPTITEKYPICGSLVVRQQLGLTVFGNDTLLYVFDGKGGGVDDAGSIPFGTKFIWWGGHVNVTTDPVIRDLWLSNGFSVEVVDV